MTIVASDQPIASAFLVLHGKYGDVTRYAQQRGVWRQSIDHEAAALRQPRQKQGKAAIMQVSPQETCNVLAPGKLEKGGRDVRSIIGNLSVESCG